MAPKLTTSFWQKKRKELASNIQKQSLIVLFSAETKVRSLDVNYPFRQQSDLLYLCGLNIPDICLVILNTENNGN